MVTRAYVCVIHVSLYVGKNFPSRQGATNPLFYARSLVWTCRVGLAPPASGTPRKFYERERNYEGGTGRGEGKTRRARPPKRSAPSHEETKRNDVTRRKRRETQGRVSAVRQGWYVARNRSAKSSIGIVSCVSAPGSLSTRRIQSIPGCVMRMRTGA